MSDATLLDLVRKQMLLGEEEMHMHYWTYQRLLAALGLRLVLYPKSGVYREQLPQWRRGIRSGVAADAYVMELVLFEVPLEPSRNRI